MRPESSNRVDGILLAVLVGGRHHVESQIIHHDVSANGATKQLVRILTLCHAGDHASLLGKGVLLLERWSFTSKVVHEERASLGAVDEHVLMGYRQHCVQAPQDVALVSVIKGLYNASCIRQSVVWLPSRQVLAFFTASGHRVDVYPTFSCNTTVILVLQGTYLVDALPLALD